MSESQTKLAPQYSPENGEQGLKEIQRTWIPKLVDLDAISEFEIATAERGYENRGLLIRAESDAELGMSFFEKGEFKKSELHFVRASQLFLELELFNQYLHCQLMYIKASSELKYSKNFMSLQEITELEEEAQRLIELNQNNPETLGLIKIEKSLMLFDLKNFDLAKSEALQAEAMFARSSDLSANLIRKTLQDEQKLNQTISQKINQQIARMQLCDCLIALGERDSAVQIFTGLSTEEDENLDYIREYLKWRLGLIHGLRDGDFSNVPLYWKQRLQSQIAIVPETSTPNLPNQLRPTRAVTPARDVRARREKSAAVSALAWFVRTGHFVDSNKRIYGQIKLNSFEGKLIRYLIESGANKDHICAFLWPEEGKSELLRTRFHSLVKRINYKIKDIVQFNGEKYKLGFKIEIRE